MFQADIKILNDRKQIIHEFNLNLATMPREYDQIAILAKLVDYVDEDVITVIVQPKSLK